MSDVMRQPRIEKVVVNIGVGEAGERLVKAQKVLEMLTGQKPILTLSNTTNRDLGIRKGMPIGCKVTLRHQNAKDFLKKALWIRENQMAEYSFDPEGNLSFGISDFTDFEGMKYNPEIGIFGMDVNVVIQRPGYRVRKRRIMNHTLPKKHRIGREEAMDYMKEQFAVEVIE